MKNDKDDDSSGNGSNMDLYDFYYHFLRFHSVFSQTVSPVIRRKQNSKGSSGTSTCLGTSFCDTAMEATVKRESGENNIA